MPKIRTAFWESKFARNVERDRENRTALRAHGWCVIDVWECDVKANRFLEPLLVKIGQN